MGYTTRLHKSGMVATGHGGLAPHAGRQERMKDRVAFAMASKVMWATMMMAPAMSAIMISAAGAPAAWAAPAIVSPVSATPAIAIPARVSPAAVPPVVVSAAATTGAAAPVTTSPMTTPPASASHVPGTDPAPVLQKLPPYQNKVTEYIDRSSIRVHGNHASATFMQDFDDEMVSHGLPFASVRFSVMYNCAANTYRTLSYATWSGHMGKGRKLADGPVPRGEMTVDPSLEDGRRIACGR
ncbi:surface-adhesin E family protein [Novacetimonas hansenii]|uniref:surface-adhesin E family protein n=1 Tax=Novacetimonas hansenii TaxID=436 RepID=UPI001EF0E3BB|nr:surface-adhesin E family protein [Novacetimonas hansenii]